MEIPQELRALQRDLDELGDSVASVLLQRAERCFLAWRMDERERYLGTDVSRVQKTLARPEPPRVATYFASCALVVA